MFGKIFQFLKQFFKRPRNLIIFLLALGLVVFIGFKIWGGSVSAFQTTTAKLDTISQTITATGRVKPSENIDLAFEKSGKLVTLNVSVGDKVRVGQLIAQMDNSELAAQAARESANVAAVQAKLDQLINGARAEDIAVSQTTLDNAQKVLTETETKNTADILRSALNTAINATVAVADIQSNITINIPSEDSFTVSNKKEQLLYIIYGQSNLGHAGSWYFLTLNGGLKQKISDFEKDYSTQNPESLLSEMKTVLYQTQSILDSVLVFLNGPVSYDAEITTINNQKTTVISQITALTNQETNISNAKNAVASAKAQLALKNAPASNYDLSIARSQLAQAQANLDLIHAQMAKNILRSPINGIVGNINPQKGELISAGTIVASIIGTSKFEIEVNIPEADIAKVEVGNLATVTLDTYGQDVVWQAQVKQIYPAENIIEGVATYKTVLNFFQEDERIRSGMTANLDILNETKNNVLVAPQRALIRKNGKKFLKLLVGENTVREVQVETGLVGSDGKIEITSGIIAGDKIVSN